MATRLRNVRGAAGPNDVADDLFAPIVAFLDQQGLSPDPANYAIAYEVVGNFAAARMRDVMELPPGGVRRSDSDTVRFDGHPRSAAPARSGGPAAPIATTDPEPSAQRDAELVQRTSAQIEGWGDTLRAIHSETNDLGHDLAASAEAIRVGFMPAGMERITHLTAAMIERVHRAETRLEKAKRETAELRAALQEARSSAQTDPLTGLPNRRALDDVFAALPVDANVAVALCDIDHFKRVNDGFGHAVGDRVLKLVAQLLEREVGCTVARYGGEEFALLFEDADVDAVLARIEAARRAVTAQRLRDRDSERPIGTIDFSAGVVLGQAGETLPVLMRRADRALYAAKQAGRGCTIVAP